MHSLLILFLCANLLLENTIIMECLLTKNLFEDKQFCSDAYLLQRIKDDPNALYVLLSSLSGHKNSNSYSKPDSSQFRFFKIKNSLKGIAGFSLVDDSDDRRELKKLWNLKQLTKPERHSGIGQLSDSFNDMQIKESFTLEVTPSAIREVCEKFRRDQERSSKMKDHCSKSRQNKDFSVQDNLSSQFQSLNATLHKYSNKRDRGSNEVSITNPSN